MGRFTVGDRVILTTRKYKESPSNPKWGGELGYIEGTVVQLIGDSIRVNWDNGATNGYTSSDLGFANSGGPMNPNTEFRRRRVKHAKL